MSENEMLEKNETIKETVSEKLETAKEAAEETADKTLEELEAENEKLRPGAGTPERKRPSKSASMTMCMSLCGRWIFLSA